MKVLVTGAGGYLGRRVVAALATEGHGVRAMLHKAPDEARGAPGSAARPLPADIETLVGDVRDPAALDDACQGEDAVIHLAAILREAAHASYQDVNVQGTKNVVAAAERAGVQRFVFMSALGAADRPALRYSHSRWLAEEAVRASALDWTIVRSSVLFGEGFGFVSRLVQSLRMSPPPIVPLPAGGKTLFQPIAADDVARCLVACLPPNAASDADAATLLPHSRRMVEIGGPEHLSYRAMLERVMEALGVHRRGVTVPLFLMKLAAPLMGVVMKDPPVTPGELAQLPYDNITETDSVERQFGFAPQAMTASALAYLERRR